MSEFPKNIKFLLRIDDSIPHKFPNKVVWKLDDGTIHRKFGPAIEFSDGTKMWILHGIRHRSDGPAIEWAHGDKEYFFRGQKVSEEEYTKLSTDNAS